MDGRFFVLLLVSGIFLLPVLWVCTEDIRACKGNRNRLLEYEATFIPCRKCRYRNICGKQKSFQKDYYRILKARREGVTKISIQCSYFEEKLTGGTNDEKTKTT